MCSKLYIVRDSYFPGTAATNRLIGLLKEFSKEKVDCDVVFFMPDFHRSTAPHFDGIHYHYYWRFFPFTNNTIRQVLYLFVYIYLFFLRVKPGDLVYLYGCDEMVPLLVRRKGVHVYQERTEHTDYSKNRFLNYDKYFKACKQLDGLFVISRNLKEFYISKGVEPQKIYLINMTVDADRFNNLIKQECDPYIAYCGSAFNNKDGVDELIKAFAIFHNSYPSVKLFIIGSTRNNAEMNANLELISDLGLLDSVVLTGQVNSENVPQLLKNAAALALARPSNKQAYYGFPTKLGEYLMTANPVVVTNVGNIGDFLEDNVSAFIAEPMDSQGFADKLNLVFSSYDFALTVGKRGYDVAMNHFNASIEAKKVLNVLRIIA